ncbi:IS481 family transposase [Elizabethkingia miricola]|uniref:IS481 family transposase n=1 Tax=Elizabethkingia miricola TaxID=172045 RepID=UPI002018CA63|nr:IS481 family transposase [Elizabethkingia miricola]MCL1655466.1 IS481 family transposase [Elizabethkingia miricola]
MNKQQHQVKARKDWLKIYLESGSVTKTALRCGIARSTLHRWIKRYKEEGEQGLSDKSRRPKTLTNTKVTKEIESIILDLREKKRWGAARISIHLLRKGIILSAMTVWRVLYKHKVNPVVKRRKKSDYKRYSKEIPGDRVQLDVTKIRNKAYQFTAIDDCTRMKVIRIYPNKKAESTINFLGEILDTFYFPIQHIQTDWGTEFFNYSFQYELHEHFIKYRPIKPRSPHLNGKVERTQQTDKSEFWSLVDLSDSDLDLNALAIEWQEFYNKKRPHSSLNGKTPWEKLQSLEHLIPIQPDVTTKFWDSNEVILPRNYTYLSYIKQKNINLVSKPKRK